MAFRTGSRSGSWTKIALVMLVGGLGMAVIAMATDVYVSAAVPADYESASRVTVMRVVADRGFWLGLNVFFAGVVLLCFSRLFETSSFIVAGFDGTDAARVQGPDENGVVWIGRTYASRVEAEAIANALKARLEK